MRSASGNLYEYRGLPLPNIQHKSETRLGPCSWNCCPPPLGATFRKGDA